MVTVCVDSRRQWTQKMHGCEVGLLMFAGFRHHAPTDTAMGSAHKGYVDWVGYIENSTV